MPSSASDDLLARLTATSLVLSSDAAYSHITAAWLWAAPMPPRCDWRVHVTVPASWQPPRRRGLVGHEAELPGDHLTTQHGLTVTSTARTFVDLGAVLDLADLVAVGDFFVGQQLCRLGAIDEVLAWASGRRGVRRARLARTLINGAARSRPESLIRVWCSLGGLPEPEVNGWIEDPFGVPCYQGDLVFRAARVIVEYDGGHHRDADQFTADLRRRNHLQRWGWRIVHVEASMLRRRLEVVSMIRDALSSAGH